MSVLVGYSGAEHERPVLDLGIQLARTFRRRLSILTVVPQTWPTTTAAHTDAEFGAWARDQGQQACARASAYLLESADDVPHTTRWTPARSVAKGLLEMAEKEDATRVIVGSGTEGAYGHVRLTSISDRLVHSSPVPVVLCPRGHQVGSPTITRLTCAVRDADESERTLHRTAELARRHELSLRLVTFAVRGRPMRPDPSGADEDQVLRAWVDQATREQSALMGSLHHAGLMPRSGPADHAVGVGRNWHSAVDSLTWQDDELLVIGSSASSPALRVFLGSSANKIIRSSPVPVMVLP